MSRSSPGRRRRLSSEPTSKAGLERGHAAPTLVEYYEGASLDYRFWSPGFHMHFGYYRRGHNPFARERMLREMNQQVFARLELPNELHRVVDLGCGLGAPSRDAASTFPKWRIEAISLVPWQVEYARHLTADAGIDERLRFSVDDYTASKFENTSFDGGFAIESSCHATGPDKTDFVREAARILKPGARLVVADGFLKREPLPWPLSWILDVVCRNWAVARFANFDEFCAALQDNGFEILEARDISFRVAPSALHVPWVTLRFLMASLFQRVSSVRWGHVLASFLSPLVGAARPYFNYCLIVAERQPHRMTGSALPEAPDAEARRDDPVRVDSAQ